MRLIEQGGNKFYVAEPSSRVISLPESFVRYAQDCEEPWEKHQREISERIGYEHLLQGFLKAPFAPYNTQFVKLLFLRWKQVSLENNVEKLKHSEGFSILVAHGSSKGKWNFWDGDEKALVQDWVDQVDGKCRAAFILCCNSHNLEIRSSESVVVHPRGVVRASRVNLGLVNLRVYHPQRGYLN